jgi:predicted RNA-binding Zn ribbon-like protein
MQPPSVVASSHGNTLPADTVTLMGSTVKAARADALEERAFRLISGHRALDLLATLRDRHRRPLDCLREPADLDRWLTLAGLPLRTRACTEDLADARQLRETIDGVARAYLAAVTPDAAAVCELNEWARRPPLSPRIDERLERRWEGEEAVHAALALLAREAIELLGGPERALIRECEAAPKCSRLYLDRSRGRRRRWCQMEWCGSQAKMSAYRRRMAATRR